MVTALEWSLPCDSSVDAVLHLSADSGRCRGKAGHCHGSGFDSLRRAGEVSVIYCIYHKVVRPVFQALYCISSFGDGFAHNIAINAHNVAHRLSVGDVAQMCGDKEVARSVGIPGGAVVIGNEVTLSTGCCTVGDGGEVLVGSGLVFDCNNHLFVSADHVRLIEAGLAP